MSQSVYSQIADGYNSDSKKKRTELGQLLQILEHLYSSNYTQISSIARFTNMSHETATRNCEKLVKSGLVVLEIVDNSKKYKMTSDGMSFLGYCRNFGDILGRYDLAHVLYH